MQQQLQHYGSAIYLYKYFNKRKKYMWQEVISSKKKKKERISTIIKNILAVSIPISLCAIFSATTKTIDALTVVRILKNIIGEEKATIQYGILSGKVDTIIMLPFSFNIAFATALVPTISSAIAKKQIDIAKRRIKFSILVTILIGIPCSVLISRFSGQILTLLFPNASSGEQMLKYSAWSIIFVVLIQTINGALQGMGKVNVPVIAFGVGAVIKLVLNIIMIPKLGTNGAVIASILSYIISFIICFISLERNMDIKFETSKFVIKPIIASGIMLIFVHVFFEIINNVAFTKLNLIVTIIFGVIIYVILVILLKILSKEDVSMLPYGKKVYKKIENLKRLNPLKKLDFINKHSRSLREKGNYKK